MPDWPRYQSHKIIEAAPVVDVRIIPGEPFPVIIVEPAPGQPETFAPTEPAMSLRAQIGGYAVKYPGGFNSISPKGPFEDGYTRLEDQP